MESLEVDILGISQYRWPNNGSCHVHASAASPSTLTPSSYRHPRVKYLKMKYLTKFYKELRDVLNLLKTSEIKTIKGDVNVKVGRKVVEGVTHHAQWKYQLQKE